VGHAPARPRRPCLHRHRGTRLNQPSLFDDLPEPLPAGLPEGLAQEPDGVSLGSTAVLRFRPYPPVAPQRADVVKLRAAPRSIHALRGPARRAWQHSVAPVDELRWSITLRTARAGVRS
jgi:hypothetical protein